MSDMGRIGALRVTFISLGILYRITGEALFDMLDGFMQTYHGVNVSGSAPMGLIQ